MPYEKQEENLESKIIIKEYASSGRFCSNREINILRDIGQQVYNGIYFRFSGIEINEKCPIELQFWEPKWKKKRDISILARKFDKNIIAYRFDDSLLSKITNYSYILKSNTMMFKYSKFMISYQLPVTLHLNSAKLP